MEHSFPSVNRIFPRKIQGWFKKRRAAQTEGADRGDEDEVKEEDLDRIASSTSTVQREGKVIRKGHKLSDTTSDKSASYRSSTSSESSGETGEAEPSKDRAAGTEGKWASFKRKVTFLKRKLSE